MAETFTAVDLSRLPAPAVVEQLSFEAVLAAMLADLRTRDPSFTATVESDPAYKILQVCAWREVMLRARVNDAAKSVMLAYAAGADLDQLAALFGVARQLISPANASTGAAAVFESDADLRRRVTLAPEGYSVAGPTGAYIFHALSADPLVADAACESPSPGQVVVTVLSRDGIASPALLAKVAAALSADTVRPLTDQVIVQPATLVDYEIDAAITTFPGPDASVVLAEANAQLDALIADTARLGRDITRSAIFAALHVPGVQRVDLASPAADIAVASDEVAVCTARAVTHAGVAE
ncbi:MAG: baseplate J/gp47 family protein [Sphingomonadales bacterium]|jgi:phage-related baseplate assembly protein